MKTLEKRGEQISLSRIKVKKFPKMIQIYLIVCAGHFFHTMSQFLEKTWHGQAFPSLTTQLSGRALTLPLLGVIVPFVGQMLSAALIWLSPGMPRLQ